MHLGYSRMTQAGRVALSLTTRYQFVALRTTSSHKSSLCHFFSFCCHVEGSHFNAHFCRNHAPGFLSSQRKTAWGGVGCASAARSAVLADRSGLFITWLDDYHQCDWLPFLARSDSTELRQRLSSAQYLSCLTLQARKYHPKNRPVQPLSTRIWTSLNRHWVTVSSTKLSDVPPASGQPSSDLTTISTSDPPDD